jgi:hypothetical protein
MVVDNRFEIEKTRFFKCLWKEPDTRILRLEFADICEEHGKDGWGSCLRWQAEKRKMPGRYDSKHGRDWKEDWNWFCGDPEVRGRNRKDEFLPKSLFMLLPPGNSPEDEGRRDPSLHWNSWLTLEEAEEALWSVFWEWNGNEEYGI